MKSSRIYSFFQNVTVHFNFPLFFFLPLDVGRNKSSWSTMAKGWWIIKTWMDWMEKPVNLMKWYTWYTKSSQKTKQGHTMNSCKLMKQTTYKKWTWRVACKQPMLFQLNQSWQNENLHGTGTRTHKCNVLLMSFKHNYILFLSVLMVRYKMKMSFFSAQHCIMLPSPNWRYPYHCSHPPTYYGLLFHKEQ